MCVWYVFWGVEVGQKEQEGREGEAVSGRVFYLFFFNFNFFCFLAPQPQHTEVPRLGVESELLLPAYATATAMQDPSRVSNLHHSSRQRRIFNPLSEARDRT